MAALTGKVALVTGGGRGIGRAIAERLAADGAETAITYLSSENQAQDVVDGISRDGGHAIAIKTDVGDPDQVRAAVAQTIGAFGGIDILVNNAGIVVPGLIDDISLEDFDRAISVNVRGVFVATQAAAAHMKAGGRIINIGSISADFMPYSGRATYAMTKGAVASLTRGLARDLGARGITVNNVQPGRVATDLLRNATGESLPQVTEAIAVRRLGEPEEVAALVAYLASADAGYVTGANMRIDGGTSV